MQHPVINQYLYRPYSWLVQKNVSYWHQGAYQICPIDGRFHFAPAHDNMSGKKKRLGRIVILSRWHYQEFVNHYPIARLSELKQVLKTEFQQHNHVLHYIAPLEQQRRAVCTVVVAEETAAQLDQHCLLVPESVLLWQAAQRIVPDSPQIYEVRAHSAFFIYTGGQVPISQRINNFCLDEQTFKLNNGVPADALCERILDTDYANQLVTALYTALPVAQKVMLYKRASVQRNTLPLKSMAIAAASVTVLYLLAVAAYYQVSIDERKAELQALGSDVNQLLDQQQALQNINEEAASLVEQRGNKPYNAHIWQVLIKLIEENDGLILQNLTSDNDRIVLRGQASQATEILADLQASELVYNARFDASVRRQQDKDLFVISLQLIQQPSNDSVSKGADESDNTAMEIVDAAQ